MKTLILILSIVSYSLMAHEQTLCQGFAPENDVQIGIEMTPESENTPTQKGGITQKQFNEVIDLALEVYGPIVNEKGGNLTFSRQWSNSTVNASASRSGNDYIVTMYGGLARHWAVSQDAFMAVVCHELGHHIGGIPTKGDRWASTEGQSDYWATLKCLRTLFKHKASYSLNNKPEGPVLAPSKEVTVHVRKQCEVNFQRESEDYQICLRSTLAGYNLARLLEVLASSGQSKAQAHFFSSNPTNRVPATKLGYNTPDPKVVVRTSYVHPPAQCRLDTYFQGALCHVDENQDVGYEDETQGSCARVNGDQVGMRPLCWFKPQEGSLIF